VPTSPDRHFDAAMRARRLPSVNRLINGALGKHAFVPLGEDCQIGRLGLELGAERTVPLAVGAVARRAFRQKFNPAIEALCPNGITERECDIRTQQAPSDNNSEHAVTRSVCEAFRWPPPYPGCDPTSRLSIPCVRLGTVPHSNAQGWIRPFSGPRHHRPPSPLRG
jgi:hypothetical protein